MKPLIQFTSDVDTQIWVDPDEVKGVRGVWNYGEKPETEIYLRSSGLDIVYRIKEAPDAVAALINAARTGAG